MTTAKINYMADMSKEKLEKERAAEHKRRMGTEYGEVITPERIAKHRERLGSEFTWVETLHNINRHGDCTWDAIQKWTNTIGDLNPLYYDPEYGKKTRYGDLVAPPSFLMSCHPGQTIQGMRGVHIAVGGNYYTLNHPVLRNDKLTIKMIFADLEEKQSSAFDGGPLLIEHYDTTFINQYGMLVARQDGQMLRFGRDKVGDGLVKSQRATEDNMPNPWTEEQIHDFEDRQLNEVIRGAEPRFWEDVNVGDKLPECVRGPVSFTDLISQLTGFSVWKSGPVLIRDLRKHPGFGYLHPLSRAYEHIEAVHNCDIIAHAFGFPHPYDSGHVRSTLIQATLLHWAGDHCWLKKVSSQARQFFYMSDVAFINTEITRKYIDEDGEHCIETETAMVNNRGALIMPSHATIVLPSKTQNEEQWPVATRMAAREAAKKAAGA